MSLTNPALDYLVRSFHPGYMDTPESDTIPHGGTPDAKNCLFGSLQVAVGSRPGNPYGTSPRAVLEKRTGARLLTPTRVNGAAGFDGLCEFRKVGQTSGRVVAVVNGKVWYWDNVSSFIQVGATQPFAPGTKVRFSVQRNVLSIMDGTTTRCWDGVLASDLFTPGQVAPTAAGALTVTAGPGVTGTYEGFQVWYDSTHDHESSPSALTAQVAFVNQTRTWAKPAGAPGANYDKWRIYCRRVDTNENYYKKVGDVAIATVTFSETMTDAARNLAALGPLPLSNDAPPLNFEFQAEFQGYRLGVVANDDQVYVSKLGDPQSQHPSDILGVSRGTGGELRSAIKFGTELVLQKASKTYRLKGDRMPYIPDEVHSTFGNVGPESAVEVKGRFFAWDEDKGPYWTDLQANWEPIGTARIGNIVSGVPKTQARFIECRHLKDKNLVVWAVPQGSATRRRTLIGWHTELESWLPPITGLEYASMATLIDTTGASQLYVGDYWGRLFQYFTDDVEGVPSGSLIARVVSATGGSVTCDNALTINSAGAFVVGAAVAFYTTGNGLMGLPVLHIDASGNTQWRRIQSNTGAVLTLDTTNDSAWNTLPVAGDTIVVGGIDWYWRSPLIDYADPFRQKVGRYIGVQARPGSAGFRIKLSAFKEGFSSRDYATTFTMSNTGGLWGAGLWGSMVWGGGDSDAFKTRLKRTFFAIAIELSNPYPNHPAAVLGLRVTADPLRGRLRRSGVPL